MHIDRVDLGPQDQGYSLVLAHALKFSVECLPEHLDDQCVLVGPTTTTPVLRSLSRLVTFSRIYAFDPREEYVAEQRRLAEGLPDVDIRQGFINELPDAAVDAKAIINPLGWQEFLEDGALYAKEALERCHPDGKLITLDWGLVRYPERFVDIPGIREEIEFARTKFADRLTADSGWTQEREREFDFSFSHTRTQIEAILPEAGAEELRGMVDSDASIMIEASLIARTYTSA